MIMSCDFGVVVQDEPTALPGGPEELPPRLQEPL